MTTLRFGGVGKDRVLVAVEKNYIRTVFLDGACSRFYPPVDNAEFCKCATMFGYTNAMQYGLEHDITHSWQAFYQGKPYSEVVWAEAHGSREKPQQVYDDEEHLVNRLLKYLNTGEVDTDYEVLRGTFGSKLPDVARDLWMVLRVHAVAMPPINAET